MSDGEFRGFRAGALTFLRSLKRNNTREWFQAHRDDYEREVRAPLAALVEEMDVRFAELAPEIVGDPKRSLFRIHRDVRFSSDKSPYKTNAACWFYHGDAGRGVGSTTPHGGAGFYFHMEPGELDARRRDLDAAAPDAGTAPRADRRGARLAARASCAMPRCEAFRRRSTSRRC